MNAANLHSSNIAVNILILYAYFIAPPHLQYFGKVVVQPSVSCIAKRWPQALQCLSSCIFVHPFFLSVPSNSRRGSSSSHRTTVRFSCNRRSYSRRRVVVTQDHSSRRRDSHHSHRRVDSPRSRRGMDSHMQKEESKCRPYYNLKSLNVAADVTY